MTQTRSKAPCQETERIRLYIKGVKQFSLVHIRFILSFVQIDHPGVCHHTQKYY